MSEDRKFFARAEAVSYTGPSMQEGQVLSRKARVR